MPRLLIILALLPILAAFILRWWFGTRTLKKIGTQQCRCNLAAWEKAFGKQNLPPTEKAHAAHYAQLLRKTALLDWQTSDPKAAKSRQSIHRFGMAVPPLTLMVALLAALVGRLPIFYLLPIFLIATAAAATISYLSIAPELKAILKNASRLRSTHTFPRREDEDTVITLTTALAWKEAAPPIFNLLQR